MTQPIPNPRVLVDPPALSPPRYGLLSVAQVVTGDGGPDHWQYNGFEWQTDACVDGLVWAPACPPPGTVKEVDEGVDLVESGDPFTIYAGVNCGSVGLGDAEARARRRLAAVEQRVAERHIWQTQITVGATDLTPGGAVPLIRGIALLEQALAEGYAGTGVIHAPRWVAGYAAHADQLRHDGPLLRTHLDTPYAFGLGYDPDGTVGQPVRLYATGVPVIYRTDVFVPAALDEALDRITNQVFLIAERTYVAAFDCGHWSVEVTVAELET